MLDAEFLQQIHRIERLDLQDTFQRNFFDNFAFRLLIYRIGRIRIVNNDNTCIGFALEAQVFLIAEQIDDFQIDVEPKAFHLFEKHRLEVRIMPHAHKRDLFDRFGRIEPLFSAQRSEVHVCHNLFELARCRNAIDAQNRHHAPIEFGIPEVVVGQRLHAQRFDDEPLRLEFIAEKLVVVDVVHLKPSVISLVCDLAVQFFGAVNQSLRRRLNCPHVDICPQESPPELHGNCLCRTASHKAVEYEVAWIR